MHRYYQAETTAALRSPLAEEREGPSKRGIVGIVERRVALSWHNSAGLIVEDGKLIMFAKKQLGK